MIPLIYAQRHSPVPTLRIRQYNGINEGALWREMQQILYSNTWWTHFAELRWTGLVFRRSILRAISTELPEVEIGQSFRDLAFETESGELLHYEFQTTKEQDLYRFLLYDAHLAAHYKRPVKTVVLYVRDVLEAPDRLNAGGIQYHVQNVYLKAREAEVVLERLEEDINSFD